MGGLTAVLPSSLLLSSPFHHHASRRSPHLILHRQAPLRICFSARLPNFPTDHFEPKQCFWKIKASVISDSKVPTTFTVDSAGGGIDILPDSGGSNDNFGGPGDSSGGGGGGNGGGGDDDETRGGSEESDDKKTGLSMSQKLTLGYAILVGIGGVMGYLKGGSQKSLIAGGVSASMLYLVFTLLPSNPVLASSIGLGVSASLLGVMGSRFKRSGKIFPAGVVSVASLVMTGGYVHGILRSLH